MNHLQGGCVPGEGDDFQRVRGQRGHQRPADRGTGISHHNHSSRPLVHGCRVFVISKILQPHDKTVFTATRAKVGLCVGRLLHVYNLLHKRRTEHVSRTQNHVRVWESFFVLLSVSTDNVYGKRNEKKITDK